VVASATSSPFSQVTFSSANKCSGSFSEALTVVMQNETFTAVCGKPFWIFGAHLIKPFSIGLAIIHNLAVSLSFDWQRYAFLGSCDFHLCFGTLSLRHVGYSLGGVLAQSCLISF
jgi:hypothetical protein